MNFSKSVFLSKFVVLTAGILIFSFSNPAYATTFYVDTHLDSLAANGRCSLREAIISANTDTNYNSDCTAAGSGADTIVLRSRGYCLSLTNATEGEDEDDAATGDLDILGDLTIQGGGQELTSIDAGASDSTDLCATLGDRIFDITSGTTVSLSGMTITGGSVVTQGGGIFISSSGGSDPVLNLQEVAISDNAISGSSLEGGGLYGYSSTITLTDSTITNNSISAERTGHGGGICVDQRSTLTLTDSTVSNNVIQSSIWAYGAGIYGNTSSNTINLINSTISGNRTEGASYAYGGGVYQKYGIVNLLGSTVSGNQAIGPSRAYGGGICLSTFGTSGAINTKNTLLSGNDVSGSSSTYGADCYGTLSSYGYNFIASVTTTNNCTRTEVENSGTDITINTHDELLIEMLTDNGGETQTHALQSSSPAIDMGNCESFFDLNGDSVVDTTSDILTTDQRGQSRTSPCDIGAYEYVSSATCGDGARTGSETCDDSNTTSGDGCSSTCASETDADSDGYSPYSNDCDDTDSNVYSGATESCNDTDDDCDGVTDEGCSTYYIDADGDGYGDTSISTSATSTPTGYVSNDNDCDDTSSSINPGVDDICDGINTNCNDDTDEDDPDNTTILYEDADSDGYGNSGSRWNSCTAPSGYVSDDTDCDDTSATIHPGATEDCTDGIDQDCDFIADYATFYADGDGDGYGDATSPTSDYCEQPSGYATTSTDCDDINPAANPNATETCEDGIDQDCDGTDASCPATDDPAPTSETDCSNGTDDDADGASDCNDSDCDASCTDTDGDGITDADDFAPTDSSESSDTDGDGVGDSADTDDDGDGVADADESGSTSASSSSGTSSGSGCAIGATRETQNPYTLILTLVFGFGALALPRFRKE